MQGGIAHKHTVAKELYDAAPIDDEFIDNIRRANVGKLVFENGYWDFEDRAVGRLLCRGIEGGAIGDQL